MMPGSDSKRQWRSFKDSLPAVPTWRSWWGVDREPLLPFRSWIRFGKAAEMLQRLPVGCFRLEKPTRSQQRAPAAFPSLDYTQKRGRGLSVNSLPTFPDRRHQQGVSILPPLPFQAWIRLQKVVEVLHRLPGIAERETTIVTVLPPTPRSGSEGA